MPAVIRGYMAASLDGYIADREGGVDFLKPYEGIDYGFTAFLSEIGTCIFGRSTFEQSVQLEPPGSWSFASKRVVVVSSRPLIQPPPNVETWDRGVCDDLVRYLRAAEGGDVWVVGGARLQGALLDLGAVDRLEIGLIPVLLGDGVPMFPKSQHRTLLDLVDVRRFDRGLLILDYRRSVGTRGG